MELLLLRPEGEYWQALVLSGPRLKPGQRFTLLPGEALVVL